MRHRRARNAALLLGVGLGGFLDGIVLQQVSHGHQLLSTRWHQLALAGRLAGVFLRSAVRGAGPMPAGAGAGYLLVGWEAFVVAIATRYRPSTGFSSGWASA